MTRMPNLYPYFMGNCSSYYPCFGGSKIRTHTHTLILCEWMNEWRNEWNERMKNRKENKQTIHTHDVSRVFQNRRRVQWHTHRFHVCFVLFSHSSTSTSSLHPLHFTSLYIASLHLTSPHLTSFLFSFFRLAFIQEPPRRPYIHTHTHTHTHWFSLGIYLDMLRFQSIFFEGERLNKNLWTISKNILV